MAKYKVTGTRYELAELAKEMKVEQPWLYIQADEHGNGVWMAEEAPTEEQMRVTNVRCEPVEDASKTN